MFTLEQNRNNAVLLSKHLLNDSKWLRAKKRLKARTNPSAIPIIVFAYKLANFLAELPWLCNQQKTLKMIRKSGSSPRRRVNSRALYNFTFDITSDLKKIHSKKKKPKNQLIQNDVLESTSTRNYRLSNGKLLRK